MPSHQVKVSVDGKEVEANHIQVGDGTITIVGLTQVPEKPEVEPEAPASENNDNNE